MKTPHFLPLSLICTLLTGAALAQSFTGGNLAVLRVGDGTQALSSSGNSLFIDQYTPTGVVVNRYAMPDSGDSALLLSGSAGSEGGLTRSLDRTLLTLAGYHTNLGTVSGSLANTTGAAVPRGIATLDAFGTYTLAQTSTVAYSANNIRCATGDGTNNFWAAGANTGTCYFNPPNPPLVNQANIANTRFIRAVNGNVYFSTQSGTAGLYTFQGGGLPTGTAVTSLVFATGSGSQIAGFTLNPAGTVAYVADQRNSAGGIQKWTSNTGTWSLAYTFPTGAGAFAVAADFSGPAPVVYATTGEAVSNRLVCVVDTNATAVITLLATAGSNRAFRAVDWAPDLRPLIVSQPQSQVVTNGADAGFSVTAESVYPLTYQWQLDGNVLDGATNATLTLSNVAAADQGTYQVWVTNQYGAVLSAEAALTVNTVVVPPQFTLQPLSQTNALGGTVTLAAAASGSEPLAWQWFLNSSPLPGETSATLTLNCLSPDQQGTYSVQVTNSAGSTNSDTAFVAAVVPPASFVAYTTPGMIYTQDFNDLPNPGTTSVNSDNPVTINGAVYNLANPFDFAYPELACGGLLGGLGQTSLAGWYGMGATAVKLGASAGDQSTGGIISFGLTNSDIVSANRALGLLATSSTGPTGFGVQLINETTNTLNQVTLHFTGELWRQAAIAKTIEFSYWIDLTATNSFTTNFTAALPALNVSFTPDPADTTPIPVDGTAAANQVELGIANHPIADWPPGAALWLVWQMTDPTGKGQGLAVADLNFSASVTPPLVLTSLGIQQAGTNLVLAWPQPVGGYTLQSSIQLGAGESWLDVAAPVVLSNGWNTVTVPASGAQQFFRLSHNVPATVVGTGAPPAK